MSLIGHQLGMFSFKLVGLMMEVLIKSAPVMQSIPFMLVHLKFQLETSLSQDINEMNEQYSASLILDIPNL